jgi:glycine/D-amino acid oxidase-like deaminating enzyme
MHVVICGGGVIGTCVAYFLSRSGVSCTVIERHELACAASGKAGGFLARDWCDGTPLEALGRRSFALHSELARSIPADWGYRRVDAFGGKVSSKEPDNARRADVGSSHSWLSAHVQLNQQLGSVETTAQVHPGLFTCAMMRAAEANGARLVRGEVTELIRTGDEVCGVRLAADFLEADAVVIALGPWSRLAQHWGCIPDIYGLKGHSLVFETGGQIPAELLFLEWRDETGALHSPEVFPRLDGTTYVCAINSAAPLPLDPADVSPDDVGIQRLEQFCHYLSPVLAKSRIIARQACYRPMTRDGLPIIGALPHMRKAFIATGHGVWGILNAPATGEVIAELIVQGETHTIDLRPFSAKRRS